MLDANGGFMAANENDNNDNNIQDDIIRLVQEHGNLEELQRQPPQQQPLPVPDAAAAGDDA